MFGWMVEETTFDYFPENIDVGDAVEAMWCLGLWK